MNTRYIKLQPSEAVVVRAAAQIYSAYLTMGRVPEGEEQEWMNRSIQEAIYLAITTDDMVVSDDEL